MEKKASNLGIKVVGFALGAFASIAALNLISHHTASHAYGSETSLGEILSTQFEEVDIGDTEGYIGKGGIPAVHKDYYRDYFYKIY